MRTSERNACDQSSVAETDFLSGGPFSLSSKISNSLMVKILGSLVRVEEPFTRTRLIGFRSIGINSHRMAQLKSRCIMSRMWLLLLPASFRSLIQSSTASGFTSGYLLRSHSCRFFIRLSIFLRSLALMGVTGVRPPHTTFGFLLMSVLPHCALDARSARRLSVRLPAYHQKTASSLGRERVQVSPGSPRKSLP